MKQDLNIINVMNLSKHFKYYENKRKRNSFYTKIFSSKIKIKEALKDISFSINKGERVGFLGPNGAGKTTTLKILAGIMHPSRGTAQVLGYTPWERKKDFRMRISIIMGQRSQLWPDLPASETFALNRAIYEIPLPKYNQILDELIELFRVGPLLSVPVRRLSLGERMKMDIIAGFLHCPEVVFLDEPTIGLDILSQNAIRKFIYELNQRYQTTFILTSHHLADIENVCDRLILINTGALLFNGPLLDVKGSLSEKRIVKLTFSSPVSEERLRHFPELRSSDGLVALFEVDKSVVSEFSQNILKELPVFDLTIEETPLEESIIKYFEVN